MSAFCKGMRNQISIGLICFINLQDSPALFPTLLRCQCPYLTSLNLLQLSSAGFVPANQGVWITSRVLIFLTFKRIPPLKTISSPSNFYSPVVGCLWTFRFTSSKYFPGHPGGSGGLWCVLCEWRWSENFYRFLKLCSSLLDWGLCHRLRT